MAQRRCITGIICVADRPGARASTDLSQVSPRSVPTLQQPKRGQRKCTSGPAGKAWAWMGWLVTTSRCECWHVNPDWRPASSQGLGHHDCEEEGLVYILSCLDVWRRGSNARPKAWPKHIGTDPGVRATLQQASPPERQGRLHCSAERQAATASRSMQRCC